MKINRLIWVLPLALTVGCVQSHRTQTPKYAVVHTPVTTTAERDAVRVYSPDSGVPLAPPKVIATEPATVRVQTPVVVDNPPVVNNPTVIVQDPPRVVTTTPSVINNPVYVADPPPGAVVTSTVAQENLALAENIRRMLATDSMLNSAARDVRMAVYNGRVTMTGRTPTQVDRERLNAAIAGIPGVYRVEDKVEVTLQR